MTTEALRAIEIRIWEIEQALSATPLFRELSILRDTRDELKRVYEAAASDASSSDDLPVGEQKKVTILEGAKLALEDRAHPMGARELVEAISQYGGFVGGKNPTTNLSSILSKRGDDFVSIVWNGQRAWWLRNRPVPDVPSMFEEAESSSPYERLSASNLETGGSYGTALAD